MDIGPGRQITRIAARIPAACAGSAPSSSPFAWCSSPARSAPCSISAFKLDARSSAIVALAALTGMALYNTISNRLRDRGDLGDQIADLSRGTADLARQVAELGRRINAMEARIEGVGGSRARRGRSDRRRDRRTGRAGAPDRRHGGSARRPCCRSRAPVPQRGAADAAEQPAAAADGAARRSPKPTPSTRAPLPRSEPRGHRRTDRRGGRRQPHRSLSAADRHAAAAQGALLRGDVAPAHRGRRRHPGRRLHRRSPKPSG